MEDALSISQIERYLITNIASVYLRRCKQEAKQIYCETRSNVVRCTPTAKIKRATQDLWRQPESASSSIRKTGECGRKSGQRNQENAGTKDNGTDRPWIIGACRNDAIVISKTGEHTYAEMLKEIKTHPYLQEHTHTQTNRKCVKTKI